MNKEETLALYEQGRDAWNAWAEEMLAEKKRLQEAGEWEVKDLGQGANDATKECLEQAQANFSSYPFEEDTDFSNFIFPGYTSFDNAQFSGGAVFETTCFEKPVSFDGADFLLAARYRAIDVKSAFSLAGVRFQQAPDFIQVHFEEGPRLDYIDVAPRQNRYRRAIRICFRAFEKQGVPGWRRRQARIRELVKQGKNRRADLDRWCQ